MQRRGAFGGGGAVRRRGGGGKVPGGMPGQRPPAGGAPDYFAQFNAFQDSNIGGQQPGPIQPGWGGFGGTQDTMLKTKMNDWLNTMPVGGQREQAMNAIGYFNSGNPYTPQVPRGTNRFYRGNARENQQTGGYSAPGIYQHMGQGQTDASGAPDLNSYGGYTGITNVAENGAAQYTPFDINAQGGGRLRRRGGTFGTRY